MPNAEYHNQTTYKYQDNTDGEQDRRERRQRHIYPDSEQGDECDGANGSQAVGLVMATAFSYVP